MRNRIRRQPLTALICLIFAALLFGCGSAPQIYSQVSQESISLRPGDLEAYGLAFITPSTVTGQEEEKQAVAFAFAQVLEKERPAIRCGPLSETLSAVNKAGVAEQYRAMFNDYSVDAVDERTITLQTVIGTAAVDLVNRLPEPPA